MEKLFRNKLCLTGGADKLAQRLDGLIPRPTYIMT